MCMWAIGGEYTHTNYHFTTHTKTSRDTTGNERISKTQHLRTTRLDCLKEFNIGNVRVWV